MQERNLKLKWTTKDGSKIRIRDMTNCHLINAIRFLRRAKASMEDSAGSAASMVTGEIASYYADMRAECVAESAVRDVFPIYAEMIREARCRGLVSEGNETP